MKIFLTFVACICFLFVPFNAAAKTKTTNPGGYVTVRVVVSDEGVKMQPSRAPRGTTAIFLLSNKTDKDRVFSIGDASLKHRRGTGFAIKLKKSEKKRVLVYLTYRGPFPSSVGDEKKSKVIDVFWVT